METNNENSIVINPELPIGTKFWFMQNNEPNQGIVTAYNVRVYSKAEDRNVLWSIFYRFLGDKKLNFEYNYSYEVMVERSLSRETRHNTYFK